MTPAKHAAAILTALFVALSLSLVSCGGGGGGADGRTVPVTGVALDRTTLELGVNQEERLVASVLPANATNQSVAWSSDNTAVAAIVNGRVTGAGPGTARVTATTENGGFKAHCDVYVRNVPVAGVSLDKTSITLVVGNADTLTPIFQPANASNQAVSWSSSNTAVASVQGGVVRAVAPGVATITVTTHDGGRVATCAVTVMSEDNSVHVTGVTLSQATMSLQTGGSGMLVAAVQPSNATNKNVTWSSSNPGVAGISGSGAAVTINANAAGAATITVTTSDGGKTAQCSVTVVSQNIPVTGVSLSQTTMSLQTGGAGGLTATIQPGNATNQAVTWTSSNNAVATVGGVGLGTTVAAVGAGTATITVTANDTTNGTKTATCAVTVTVAVVPVTGVTLSQATMALNAGGQGQLAATILPSNATNKAVTWTSSNNAVATVGGSGLVGTVTAVGAGTASITVTTQDGGHTASCVATVVVPVTGVTLSQAMMTLPVGGTGNLAAAVQPSNATNQTVTWASSNNAVATMSGNGLVGTVAAVGAGTASITVTANDTTNGTKTATCLVTVEQPVTGVTLSQTTMSLQAGGAGSLTAAIQPGNATDQAVNWTSSSQGVATVSGSGLIATVTAIVVGTANITVTTADGGHTATCVVTVAPVSVTGVTLSQSALNLETGRVGNLTATIQPANATNQDVTWSSNNTAVATVASNGLDAAVVAVSVGAATITVATADGNKTATCAVQVVPPIIFVTGVSLDLSAMTLTVGGIPSQLRASVQPANATNQAVTWTNSNNAVAAIGVTGASATVYAVSAGTTTVTVTTQDGSKTASCSVTVVATGPDVFVAGTNNSRATLWKNGTPQQLSGNTSEARSVFVAGNDVYVAGHEHDGGGTDTSYSRATVWKNGVAQHLSDYTSYARSIFVTSDDVYVAGYEFDGGTAASYSRATLWKNGAAQRLGVNTSEASSVFVLGDDVYVAGKSNATSADRAILWKNGVAEVLLGEFGYVDGGSSQSSGAIAFSVFGSTNSVYVAGRSFGSYRDLWGNWVNRYNGTVWTIVGGVAAVGTNSISHSGFVSGNDRYVVGTGNGYGAAVVKNGITQQLTGGISDARSVSISSDDVYVAGHENYIATLWKNGIAQQLGTSGSYAYSVFVK
jgi:uncharacterized protein YjdB